VGEAMKKHTLRLTDDNRLTIRLALRNTYDDAMRKLDLESPWGAVYLKEAAAAWNAYKAFAGYTIHLPVERL
jgi:hypothetical protein